MEMEPSLKFMRRLLRYLGCATAAVLLAACRPPPLTEPPPDLGTSDTAPAVRDTNTDTTPDGEEVSPPPFSTVSTILADGCAKANCHGNPTSSSSDFGIGTNDPSETEVRNSLEGVTIDDPTAPMVDAGKPNESGLYQAIEGLEGRTKMPPGDELSASKIRTIRNWIAGGAPYE